MTGRGQTQQDYLIGISLLILTMIGVFALVPGIFQPFEDPVGESEQDTAERLADTLIANTSVDGSETVLSWSDHRSGWGLESAVESPRLDRLLERSGIENRLVNVTVRDGEDRILGSSGAAASSYNASEEAAATTVRVIRFGDAGSCTQSCRLVVRVWS